MKLIFLGSGSAFTIGDNNFQSNMFLVSDQGAKLLIDCGTDIRFSLDACGFSYRDVTDIYISHLHADHVGGLEYVGLSRKFDPLCQKPKLYLSYELAGQLWNNTLSGGMTSLEGEIADLDTYFEVHKVKRGQSFTWEKLQFHLINVVHVNNGYYLMPCYGLFFEVTGTKIFITTDTQAQFDRLTPIYQQADLIFQDCETAMFPSEVHAHYQQLLTLPKSIRSKMWLYHYQPGTLPDAEKDGFRGWIERGQEFELSSTCCSQSTSSKPS